MFKTPDKNKQASLEKAKSEKKEREEEIELNDQDKLRLMEFGITQIENNPYFAAVCLKLAGRSQKELKPLLELDKQLQNESRGSSQKEREMDIDIDKKVKEMYQEIANDPNNKLQELAKNILKTLEKEE